MNRANFTERRAVLSPCKSYRYALWRIWEPQNPRYALFIGLNPSKADAVEDDNTVRRCISLAKSWGCGSLCMANLFAYRHKDPAAMKAQCDPVGSENDAWLLKLRRGAAVTIAAWGIHGSFRDRDRAILKMFGAMSCLGATKYGYPRHPLYVRAGTQPTAFQTVRAII